jgi:hypothetical protein
MADCALVLALLVFRDTQAGLVALISSVTLTARGRPATLRNASSRSLPRAIRSRAALLLVAAASALVSRGLARCLGSFAALPKPRLCQAAPVILHHPSGFR